METNFTYSMCCSSDELATVRLSKNETEQTYQKDLVNLPF